MIVQQCLNKGCHRPPGPIGFCDHHLRLRRAAKDMHEAKPMRDFHNSDFVYLIGMDQIGAMKVGRSLDPVMRLAELQAPIPLDLRLSTAFCVASDGARRLENLVHKALTARGLLMRGEWFRVGFDDAALMVEKVANENGIVIMSLRSALEACREMVIGTGSVGRDVFDAKLERLIRSCVGY